MTSPSVKAVLVLDSNDGSRIHAKYYAPELRANEAQVSVWRQKQLLPRVIEMVQLEFEKKLFAKTRSQNARNEAEIVMLDRTVSVYRQGMDVVLFVVGSAQENELILAQVFKGKS